MKKMSAVIFLSLIIGTATQTSGQSAEAQQLLLNVEKLAQLKQVLNELRKGYLIVSTGYNAIKNISEGNFNLHKTFLDGLLAVSPTIRKYKKVGDIINAQLLIVKEYKRAYKKFKNDANFTPGEISYLSDVYTNLFRQSVKNLDALTTIVTADKLRMSDHERLKAIDAISDDMTDKLLFLRQFNNNTAVLAIQRSRERNDARSLKNIYGINQ